MLPPSPISQVGGQTLVLDWLSSCLPASRVHTHAPHTPPCLMWSALPRAGGFGGLLTGGGLSCSQPGVCEPEGSSNCLKAGHTVPRATVGRALRSSGCPCGKELLLSFHETLAPGSRDGRKREVTPGTWHVCFPMLPVQTSKRVSLHRTESQPLPPAAPCLSRVTGLGQSQQVLLVALPLTDLTSFPHYFRRKAIQMSDM